MCHLPRQGKRDDLSSSLYLEREGPEGPLILTKGGRLFLPCCSAIRGKKGRDIFLRLVRVFQQKNREKRE